VVDVVPIFVAPIPSLLHQNNVGVIYARPSNFKMELLRFVPLYFVAMPQSINIITKALFVLAPIHTIDSVQSRPKALRGTNFVSLHEDIPIEVNKVFASEPLDPRGGN
jgi:hypothetical protein